MELSDQDQQVLALLAWYRDMGIDEPVGEQPFDWLTGDVRVPGAEVMARFGRARAGAAAGTGAGGRAAERDARQAGQRGSGQGASLPARSAPAVSTPGGGAPVSGAVHGGVSPGPGARTRVHDRAGAHKSQEPATIEDLVGVASLEALEAKVEAFEGCGLKQTAKNTCFYRGAANARVMMIGEAPGRDEDRAGKPFVGRAGQLLDRMLGAIGLDEQTVHIANIVYWRPPGNRTPTAIEARSCRPFVETQIRLVDPEFIVLLGGASAKSILNTTQGIMRLRGRARTLELGGAERNVIATLHPAYLLRTPAAKRLAWQDLLWLQSQLDRSGNGD